MSEKTDRFYEKLADWLPGLLALAGGAFVIVPMGQGHPESGFFLLAGFAADYWLVQVIVTLFEGRKQPGAWKQPPLLLKAALVLAIVSAGLGRGHFPEILGGAIGGGFFLCVIGLAAVVVFGSKRLWDDHVERKRRGKAAPR